MTIYIVWFNNFQGERDWCGAFSSEEKANEYISRFRGQEQQLFQIDEYSLDSE